MLLGDSLTIGPANTRAHGTAPLVCISLIIMSVFSCKVQERADLREDPSMEEPSESSPEDLEGELGLTLTGGRLSHQLLKGQDLMIGQGLVSPDHRFSAVLRAKGLFAFYSAATVVWSNGLKDGTAVRLKFMDNGDLRVIDKAGKALWSAGTGGKGAARLELTNQGQLILKNASGQAVWSQGQCCAPPEPQGELRPQIVGLWGKPFTWPLVPLHTALLPSGKVYSYGSADTGERSTKGKVTFAEWDPAQGIDAQAFRVVQIPSERSDIFCSAATLIASTGELLVAGGTAFDTEKVNTADSETRVYSDSTGQISFGPMMAATRWYPTVTALADGRILTQGGRDSASLAVSAPEVFERGADGAWRWRTLFKAASREIISKAQSRWWYPRSFVDTDGKIFGLTGTVLYKIDPTGDGSITKLAELADGANDQNAPSVMYEPGKILQLGGAPGRRGALHIATNAASGQASVSSLTKLAYPRAWGNTTLLASGEVFVSGGSAVPNELIFLPRHAEMWNPKTQAFRKLAPETVPRLYHSTALLLPDASVLVGGGGTPGPVTNTNGQIYRPPYLFDDSGELAPRPAWENVPKRMGYDQPILATMTSVDPVTKVTLLRLGSVTHSFNFDQRFRELNFKQNGKELTIHAPKTPAIMPPGYYMLFAFNQSKVPSIARIIALGTPTPADVLTAGERLRPGERLLSSSGATLDLTKDGELVSAAAGKIVWSSSSLNRKAAQIGMSTDGNLRMLDATNAVIWSSGSASNPGGWMELTGSGDLIIHAKDGKILWQATACCK